MEMYIHTWNDKKTGEICKTGEGRIASTLDQAIEDYYQELFAYQYEATLLLSEDGTFTQFDIEEEIDNRRILDMSDSEVIFLREMNRGFDDAREALYA